MEALLNYGAGEGRKRVKSGGLSQLRIARFWALRTGSATAIDIRPADGLRVSIITSWLSRPGRELGVHAHLRGRISMAKLTAAKKNSEPKSEFGLPEQRKYPMPDASHARNAKARASQMEHQGKLSAADKKKIDAKADRILKK
jgi:hypothetical protein